MTTATMTCKELNDNELNLVNGGADGAELSEPFKKLMEFLDDYDETKDPFYFPGPYLPWDPRQYQLPDYDPSQIIA